MAAVGSDAVRVEGAGIESLRPGLEITLFRRGDTFGTPSRASRWGTWSKFWAPSS